MTEPVHVRADRLRVAALRLSEAAERLSRERDRWLRHPAAPPGAAAGGGADRALRVLVAALDRYLARALAGPADAAGALLTAAGRYESSDARAARPGGAATPGPPPPAVRPGEVA